jgi:hypothetical protein
MAVEHTTTSNKRNIGGITPNDGKVFGQSATDLIAFYGTTPVVQPSGAAQATITATWVTLSAGTGFGFLLSDEIISVIAFLKEVATVFKTLGLWKGSS